jgi:hypothetical protein
MMRMTHALLLAFAIALTTYTLLAPAEAQPGAQPADASKPVKVFILLGQSNMVGAGNITGDKDGTLTHAVKEKGKYPYLVDAEGNWATRMDVRNVRVMMQRNSMRVFNNEWLQIKGGKIGPEFGIGHMVGDAVDEPVMLLKSCIGNRSLGWDLLPPGSERFEFTDPKDGKTYMYAGYKDEVRHSRWEKGTTPEEPKHDWYAGKQYDDDIANAKKVLADLDTYFPGANGYEIAGFFWWQGDKDRYDAGHAAHYEQNLVNLINSLRKDFDAPNAKFVLATLGQTKKGDGGNDGKILDAMLAVDGESGKYPQFKGNVATVYTNPVSMGGASNSHYNGNAETYMNVGELMGQAMAELLGKSSR